MAEVVTLNDYRKCELLGSLNIYRQPDGTILLGATYMEPKQIESVETVAERFDIISAWLADGLPSLKAQAQEFQDQPKDKP